MVILIISLIANGLFLYSEFVGNTSFDDKEKSIIKVFSDKEYNEMVTELLTVNPFEHLFDLKGGSILFNSILEDSQKLILVISDKSCSSCIEKSLIDLTNVLPRINVDNVIILGLYESKREFFLLSKKYPFKFLLLSESSILKDIAMKSPVFFNIDINYKISSAFFPVLKYPILSEKYLDKIVEKFKP